MPKKAKNADPVTIVEETDPPMDGESAAETKETPVCTEPESNSIADTPTKDGEAEKTDSGGLPPQEPQAAAEETEGADLREEDFAKPEPKPSARQAFYGINFREMDKDLSPDEQREWNAIYASFRAKSILTGRVAGVDTIRLGDQSIVCLVIFDYRVKVLIPQTEIWADEASERPIHVLRRFMGAELDYIVTQVDREGECVLASRKQALAHRRRSFRKHNHQPGDLVECRVLAVATTKLLLECGGYEVTLSQNSISYGTILDLREDYRPGQVVTAVFKGLDEDKLKLSIKEVNPHPFDNVESRHPLHCRRVSRIMGKYAGGVFCELEKGFTCMCLYTAEQMDCDFDPGDNVIIVVTRYDYDKKQVYGRILSGW